MLSSFIMNIVFLDTFLSVSIAVVPHATPIVVFSIDGSLTASVSVVIPFANHMPILTAIRRISDKRN